MYSSYPNPRSNRKTPQQPEAYPRRHLTLNSSHYPVTAVWETASPHMRAQLSKNFANPTKPTNEEILAVCQQAVDEFSGDIAYTVMVTKLFNEPRSELETLDSGGVYPAARLLDKLLYQDLGQGWFLLYHPMVPIGGTIEMYGGREELYSWCLYVARGQPDSKHCIDVDSTPDVMVSAWVPFTGCWERLKRINLIVPSYMVVKVQFPGQDGKPIQRIVTVSADTGMMSPEAVAL